MRLLKIARGNDVARALFIKSETSNNLASKCPVDVMKENQAS